MSVVMGELIDTGYGASYFFPKGDYSWKPTVGSYFAGRKIITVEPGEKGEGVRVDRYLVEYAPINMPENFYHTVKILEATMRFQYMSLVDFNCHQVDKERRDQISEWYLRGHYNATDRPGCPMLCFNVDTNIISFRESWGETQFEFKMPHENCHTNWEKVLSLFFNARNDTVLVMALEISRLWA